MKNKTFGELCNQIQDTPRVWLITGVAGFIGSNLLEALLDLNQKVVGLDNFSTGHQYNLDEVKGLVGLKKWENFRFINGDVSSPLVCQEACIDVNFVLHQAALGSVPRSISDPLATNNSNIVGHLNMLTAAKDAGVSSFIYAASSSTYGDHPGLPKEEDIIGNPLSPYAVSKLVNELYAQVFSKVYGFKSIGLRYFNVFGKRQDPNGAYAAVIPKWASSMIKGETIVVNGDGTTSRDFCYVSNVVQANILAALSTRDDAVGEVYNIAVGNRTSLNELVKLIEATLNELAIPVQASVEYTDFRAGDVKHSLANIGKAREKLGYTPSHDVKAGLSDSLAWYKDSGYK